MKRSRPLRRTPLKRGTSRLKRTRLRPRSRKRSRQEASYAKQRAAWLKGRRCEVCGEQATEIHHKAGRDGDRLTDESQWMAVNRVCHRAIHEHPKWAREMGYLI